MLVLPPPESDISILTIEGCLTVIGAAAAFAWPRLGSPLFLRIEHAFGRLARRQSISVLVVGLTALLLRLSILPFCPIPLPFVPDDFSFLLSADTFAHGRLTNPTPPMWMHFESIHITMQPTYMSMYFPSEGLVMAASQVLLGQPWFGLLLMSALMCAAICWMLQAWLPPTWALLGGFLAILRLGLFTYWINTYHSAGSIAAFGGALVLGSLPRLMKSPAIRHRDALLLAVGIIVLATTRPYEGLLLCFPVAVVLGRWLLFGKNRPAVSVLIRHAALPVALMVAAGSWMAYYDYRAFGSPTTLPYTVDRQAYAMAPYFVWQHARPEPAYRHPVMREFYYKGELAELRNYRSVPRALSESFLKIVRALLFFSGIALLPLLFMFRRVILDRRLGFLKLGVLVLSAGMLIQFFLIPHYLAAFTASFYALGLQAMRHMRVWKPEGKPVGLALVRMMVTICIVMAGVRLFAVPLRLRIPERPASEWNFQWYGPLRFGTERAEMAAALERMRGKQLVIVRYSPKHDSFNEWVYNSADIDGSKVIWAREMSPGNNVNQNAGSNSDPNAELIRYYKDRQVWLAEPDATPAKLSQYPMPSNLAAASH